MPPNIADAVQFLLRYRRKIAQGLTLLASALEAGPLLLPGSGKSKPKRHARRSSSTKA